jgi:hypothetical protein
MFGLLETTSLDSFPEMVAVLLSSTFFALGLLGIYSALRVLMELIVSHNDWPSDGMGDAGGRKRRLAILLVIFLVLGLWFSLTALEVADLSSSSSYLA